MTFYLDTNCLWQINTLSKHQIGCSFSSHLAILEIISGIKSEREFLRRRGILKSIRASEIRVIWKAIHNVFAESIGLSSESCDADATRIMMDAVIKANSYDELLNLRYDVCERIYDIQTMQEYDRKFNRDFVDTMTASISAVKGEERREAAAFIDSELAASYFGSLHELRIAQLALALLPQGTTRTSSEYMACMEYYNRNMRLRDYWLCVHYGTHAGLARSQAPGVNDGFDYSHLVYSCYGKYFVSDDAFFERFPRDMLGVIPLKFKEFRELTSGGETS